MNDDRDRPDELDLFSVESLDGPDLEHLPAGVSLGTFSTASTASTASCPISSATCIMTANSTG